MLNEKLEKLQTVLEALGQSGEEISYLDTVTDTFYQIQNFMPMNYQNSICLVGQGYKEDADGKQINEDGVTLSINLKGIEDIDICICGISITYKDNTVITLEVENTDTLANILDNIEGVEWESLNEEEIEEVYTDYYNSKDAKSEKERKAEDLEETIFNLKNIIAENTNSPYLN